MIESSNVWSVARNIKYKALLGSCAIVALIASATHVAAEPHIDGELAIEIAGDHIKDDNVSNGHTQNSVNPTVELVAGLFFTDALSIQGGWTLESLSETENDSYFRRLGLSTDELYMQYEAGMFRVFGGKAAPTFGTAWDIDPSVYGTGLAEDYELGEGYLAAGAAITLKAAGEHILTGTAFRLDRSFLSQTAFTASDPITINDLDDDGNGTLSNTRGFDSFSVTLDSGNIFGVDGLHTHLGYRTQAIGDVDTGNVNRTDETGFVVGASYGMDLPAAIKLEMMAEYADFSNFGGAKDNDAPYVTVGAGLNYKRFNLALSCTMKDVAGTDNTLLSASVGTEIWNEWALDVGYSLGREDAAKDVHTVGFTLAKSFEFTNGQ